MSKYFKTFLHGVKYAVYLGGATVIGGFGYLTYINSKIGGIDVDKEITTKYYNEKMGIEMGEATQMYYWLLWDIGVMRVLTYNNYSNYCDRLNSKIVQTTLTNYEKENIIQQIEALKDKKDSKAMLALYRKVMQIRKKNFQNIEIYEYIVKQVRKQQKMMDSRVIIGLEGQAKQKVDYLHAYLCETGTALKDPEILNYMKQVPDIEARFPGDYIHKILVI